MNTITHPLSTYWLFRNRRYAGVAAFACFVPDTPYLIALVWGLAVHFAPAALRGGELGPALWNALYETWANPAANFVTQKLLHNLLLATVFGAFALVSRKPALRAIAAGWALHVWVDLSLHARDAYSVLWPVTGRVFPSPVSYWDADFHGPLAGGLLALMAGLLWAWLGERLWRKPGPARPRFVRAGAYTLIALLSIVIGIVSIARGRATDPRAEVDIGTGKTPSWVDDGVCWSEGLLPIAQQVATGVDGASEALASLSNLDPARDPGTCAGAPTWEQGRPGARSKLLEGYALDLTGHREAAIAAYRRAERLETVGNIGDKARRYQGEPFQNVPDPAVSLPWIAIFLWGATLCAVLVVSVPRSALRA